MRQVYYEEADCIVYWDTDEKWIYVDWKNKPSIGTVKNGCEEMLKLMKEKKCNKVLNDNTNVTGPWSGASEWVAKDWFPRMVSSGLKKFAWIQSRHSALSRISAQRSESESKNSDVIHFFNGEAEAAKWLKR